MSSTSADVFAELSQELGAKLVGDPYPTFAERRRTTPVNALLDLPDCATTRRCPRRRCAG
jgi:hypothetical protein